MSARHLLNSAAINGAMVVALLVGVATSSFWVAIFIFMGSILAAFAGNHIRLGPRRKK